MNLEFLEKFVFYLILFLLPCNLAKHFILPFSYVSGILVDYLIPTVYLTDLLILILLFLWLVQVKISNVKSQMSKPHVKCKIFKILFLFLLITINLSVAQNQPAAFYKLIKLIEFSLFALWIKTHINIKKDISKIAQILAFSVLWQSILVISQWFNQGSIAGFWFFGEQPFDSATIGIKKISFFGQLKVVPMGTFTHPNVLAGFLAISLLVISNCLPAAAGGTPRGTRRQLLYVISFILGTTTLFLTFSFPAWLIFIFSLIFLTGKLLWKKNNRLYPIGLMGLIGLIGLIGLVGFWEPTSLVRRSLLNQIALKMFLDHPLFGVGLNNFIPNMEKYGQVVLNYRFLQPVHNVYLLVLAETGLIGLISLISLIWLIIKELWKKRKEKVTVLLYYCITVLLFLALFDHYFFTIQQGMLVATLILGLTGAAPASTTTSTPTRRKSTRRTNS